MGYGWGGWGWGGWVMMILVMVLFWGAIVVGVVALVRYGRERRQPPGPPPPQGVSQPPSALDVLDERFARGEIDAEEYTKRRDLLRTGRP